MSQTKSSNFKITPTLNGQQLIGLTIFPLSLFGLIFNSLVFYATLRIRSLSPSFAFLTGCLAFCDAMFNVLYLVFVAPMIVFDLEFLKNNSNECGYLLMVFYDASMDIHFVISLNRFFAVFAPLTYSYMFSYKMTKFYGSFCLVFSAAYMAVYSKIVNCRMPYDDKIWMFFFDKTDEFCTVYSRIINMKNISFAALGALLDVVTILRAQSIRKRQIQNSQVSQSVRRRELDFLQQTFVQGIVCLFAVALYYYVPGFISNIYVVFIMTTFMWGSLSTIDGVTALIYNSEIRAMVMSKGRVGVLTSTVDNKSRAL